MTTDLALIDTADAKALAVNAERARMMAGGRDALPRQYRDNPAALLVAFEYADALGVPRISALTGVHIVDGKPTASADLIGALVRKAGHKLRVKGDETYAEAVIIRADDPDFIPDPIRWDLDRARKAGLLGKKGPWQTYPGAMLRARAVTEAARMWASEALFGVVYTPEELGAPVDESGVPIVDGEVVSESEPRAATPRKAESAPEAAPPQGKPVLTDEQFSIVLQQIAESTAQEDLDAIFEALRGTDLGEHKDGVAQAWNERAERIANPAAESDTEQTAVDDAAAVVQETLDAEVVDA